MSSELPSLSAAAVPRAPGDRPRGGVRAAGKARSRKRLLAAAKQLFMERGYDGATVRDIARAAGLSTGAVFASFTDKLDLFNEVVLVDGAEQLDSMGEVIAAPGPVAERLLQVLSAGYAYHLRQPELLKAAISVSWAQGLRGELGDRPVRQAASGVISDILTEGVERGELRRDADVALLVETIWDSYVANYRHAFFAGWRLERLQQRIRAQIEVLLAGQRKG